MDLIDKSQLQIKVRRGEKLVLKVIQDFKLNIDHKLHKFQFLAVGSYGFISKFDFALSGNSVFKGVVSECVKGPIL